MSPRTTHVANGCDCPIWAACIPDERTSIELTAKLSENLKIRVDRSPGNAAKLSGLTKIMPDESLAFITDENHFTGERVYITIFYEKDGELSAVCSGFPRIANGSVIVDETYSVKLTKMGTIWTDTNGIDHRRNT